MKLPADFLSLGRGSVTSPIGEPNPKDRPDIWGTSQVKILLLNFLWNRCGIVSYAHSLTSLSSLWLES